MQGRLLLARGEPVSPLTIREVVKAAQAKAHREASVQVLQQAIAGLVKRASGETSGALRSTLASFASPELAQQEAQEVADTQETPGTTPGAPGQLAPPAKGLGGQWAPGAADATSMGLHEDQEKRAYLGRILAAGRRGAAALASKGGTTGRVGRFLQRDVRSPVQFGASKRRVSAGVRSPLAPSKTPPPIPKDVGPYKTLAKPSTKPSATQERVVEVRPTKGSLKRPPVKPKSLTRSLLPGALMLGAGYGLYKGVPAAMNWASRAASSPMAYNFGHQQYQYGYTPQGQAQF